jgi:hypothetical protein
MTLARAAKPTRRDLPARKEIKGGKIMRNDNRTLVRTRQIA